MRVTTSQDFGLAGVLCLDGCGLLGQGRARCASAAPRRHRQSAADGLPVRASLGCSWASHTGEGKMTSADPLKSVISIGDVDDTSLAVPSVNQFRSGEQRVREQVQTVRRTKSRQFSSRSGSASLSPTSKSVNIQGGDDEGSIIMINIYLINIHKRKYTGCFMEII